MTVEPGLTNAQAMDAIFDTYDNDGEYPLEQFRRDAQTILVAERAAALREVAEHREALAALEHEQWEKWSREVAATGLTPERIARWKRFWVPYDELDEGTKDFDRIWADRVLAILTEATGASE